MDSTRSGEPGGARWTPRADTRPCSVCGQDGGYLPHGDAWSCERSMRKLSRGHCADPSAHHAYDPLGAALGEARG